MEGKMSNHDKLTRRQFLGASIAGFALAAGSGCATSSKKPAAAHPYHPLPYSSRLEIRHPSDFRILQLTDLHWSANSNPVESVISKRTEGLINELIARSKPDLIVVTGDSWAGNVKPGGEDNMREIVARFSKWETPCVYAWGNHDRLINPEEGHKTLTDAHNSLYKGAATNGNYVVDVVNKKGRRVCQLVMMNSENSGLGASQQEWMKSLYDATEKAGEPQPLRLAFFHIPIKQYMEIWENGVANGIIGEKHCIEKEDGSTFDVIKKLGVRACFCGHDHVNNYSGVMDGVELVYGRATGYGSYGQDRVPKGGLQIDLNCYLGKMDWKTLLPENKEWRPRPGERINVLPKK
jgi:hypothetical protein